MYKKFNICLIVYQIMSNSSWERAEGETKGNKNYNLIYIKKLLIF